MRKLLLFIFLLLPSMLHAQSYSTSFPATQNPISESGKWISGSAAGTGCFSPGLQCYGDVQTSPGLAFDTITSPGCAGNPGDNCDDAIAIMSGVWGPDQTAQATVFKSASEPTQCCDEVELHLRTTITSHTIAGYEINCSVSGQNYMQLVRWNGSFSNFTFLNSAAVSCVNGDVIKATITGSTINVYRNNLSTPLFTTVDTNITTGAPGIGFFHKNYATFNQTGLSNFTATGNAPVTTPWSAILAPSRATDWSGAGLPPVLPDGETTANPWTPPTARTQCQPTIAAYTGTADIINNALVACAGLGGRYVLLGPGTFNITTPIGFRVAGGAAISGVTLRGSGPQSTIVQIGNASAISFGVGWNNGNCSWVSGFAAGSTSLTMNGCTGPALVIGELAQLIQCDTGYTGVIFQGNLTCSTGASADNGGLYICGDNNACQTNSNTSPNAHQIQHILPTSITGSGTLTVNFTPAIRMPNWSSGQTPFVHWTSNSSPGNTPQPYGNGLEAMTIQTLPGNVQNYAVNFTSTYASWIKGVRFLGATVNGILNMSDNKNSLIANNYFFSDPNSTSGGSVPPVPMTTSSSSDNLTINNIMLSGVSWEGFGANAGNVVAYNYGRDVLQGSYQPAEFDHHAGSYFTLFEGNQYNVYLVDNTWGTHNLDTYFRNYSPSWDAPYLTPTNNPRGWKIDNFQRFMNWVGNAIGPGPTGSPLSTYQSTSPAGSGYVFGFDITNALNLSTSLRWGNCDTVNGNCRFQSSEIPTTLTGNAVPFQNTVPANQILPCSFFLGGYSSTTCTPHPSGGTGLSWWKVCTVWTTFPTACNTTSVQPFPAVGSDVSGGVYVNGHAYDIPAAIAFRNLPIDTTFQNSYTITGSSWSGGTETLTVSGLPANIEHLMGGFQITGTPAACNPTGAELFMTLSTATTVNYALAANPGVTCSGTMKWPDVRQFDERVFIADSGLTQAATPVLTPAPGIYTSSQTVTITDSTPSSTIFFTTDGSTPTTSSTVYTAPILIASTTTLQAIATAAGFSQSNVGGGVYTISISNPIVSFTPSTLTFTTNQNTVSAPQIATIQNVGTANLIVSSVARTGLFGGSGLGTCPATPFTLVPGASCSPSTVFTPNATGNFTGTLTITDNAAGSPHTVNLQGTGTAPIIQLTPTSFNFGAVFIPGPATSPNFTLTNTGNGPLNVAISIGGANPAQFSATSTCPPTILPAGNSCTISVVFNPAAVQVYNATLVETDSVQGISGTSTLTGSGVTPAPPVNAPAFWIL